MFEIETDNSFFQVDFYHLQVNITSRCNMKCKHCRGDYSGRTDLSLKDFNAIMDFAKEHMVKSTYFLISGGEPLLHPNFREIMKILKKRGVELVSITTNGSFITQELLAYLEKLKFKNLRISVSLDSIHENEHNAFRNNINAYADAIRAIDLIANHQGMQCIVRTTITKKRLKEIPDIIKFIASKGVDIFSVSSVIPVGRAKDNKELKFDAKSKKRLFDIIKKMKLKYPSLIIDVNDPLRCLVNNKKEKDKNYGGCIAGIGSFSIEPNGDLLPCPLLKNQVITNIKNKTGEKILESYVKNKTIHNLIDRNFSGKCGMCKNKNMCGGCRARAEAATGDYLGSDPECFY
jgi:radical SAM protein with 4Fe4S-binding SPASM domain